MDSNITLKSFTLADFEGVKENIQFQTSNLQLLFFSIESSLNANKPTSFCVCQKLVYKYMFNKVLHRFNFNTHTCRIKK